MKKLLAVLAAAMVALVFAGCQFGDMDKDLNAKQAGTKKNLTVTVNYPGPGKKFQRGWKQLGTKETVQALETKITIDASNATGKVKEEPKGTFTKDASGNVEVNSVIGLIFDLHKTTVKAADATEAKPAGDYYDFCLIGYQPAGKKYYIERYVDIPKNAFSEATSEGVFATADTYITPTQSTAFATPGSKEYVTVKTGKMPKSDDAAAGTADISLQEITIKITQETKGTYVIDLGDGKTWTYKPTANEAYTNKDGYRIGGAGYYVNCPVGLSMTANFNSKNDNTIGLNADEEE